MFETPLDLVHKNFETNFFAPLALTQKFIAKFIKEKKRGKVLFVSSMGGLFLPAHFGVYCATKHALEAVAESLQQELKKYGIQVQTINPGAYLTGFNETMLETSFRWLDDEKNFTQKADLKAEIEAQLNSPDWKLVPQDMIDAMVKIVPSETGKFRNVYPKFVEDMLKDSQAKAWSNEI